MNKSENAKVVHKPNKLDAIHAGADTLKQNIASLERQRKILLDLGNDITKVREKNDLITLFSSGFKKYFYFTHSIISLIDKDGQTYTPFLLDPASSPIKHHPAYPTLIRSHFSLNEPFIQKVQQAGGSTSFLLEEVMNQPQSPVFLKINYEGGVREILMTPLKSKEQTIGFIHIYAKDTVSFTDEFRSIIQGIAPQLSSAVANIIKNEEIREKELENKILLSLSNEMVAVRNRSDLLSILKNGLGKLIKFTHNMMTIMDDHGETYKAFLTDSESKIETSQYNEAVSITNPVNDGIYNIATQSDKPVVFSMNFFDLEKSPPWFKFHYLAGAREMMIKYLPGESGRRHSLILFADKLNTFDDYALVLVERIASQLATVASNITANEEIRNEEREKSFLLDLSHDISTVRTKEDLFKAFQKSLKQLSPIKGYVIRKINEDKTTLSSYIQDTSIVDPNDPKWKEIETARFPIDDGLQNRVLNSPVPLLILVDAEISRGVSPPYVLFWKKIGLRKMVGTALENGNRKLGILWLATDEINLQLLQGICAQISTAMANIIAHEEVLQKEKEQELLLAFSENVAAVRTKEDLELAISTVLDKMLNTKLAMIQVIDEDGVNLTRFMYDRSLYANVINNFDALASKKIDIHEEYTSKVLKRGEALIFNVAEEIRKGNSNPFVQLWQQIGFQNTYAAPLRVGNVNMGTLWILTDNLNLRMLNGICAQISTAIANILANEKILSYKQRLEIENDYLKEQIQTIYNFSEIVGSSAAMQKVYQLISLVAESSSTALILGETGTGKELIARAIHNASPRKEKLMVKINCAALPVHLIESELFGHEKGSFTGATERRIGKFELAHNSTLFLDEIGEMPLDLQVKLLRVLQERELERIGGKTTIKVNVRVVAATNRNLEEEVKADRFRSDLFYRLNVFPIHLPPLRERLEDIESLCHYFVSRFSKNNDKNITAIAPKVFTDLKNYQWPGNVRELEHLIERSLLLTSDHVLKEVILPKPQTVEKGAELTSVFQTLEQVERTYIIESLKKCNGKISGIDGAAKLLDIPGTTLHSKIKKLGISKADYFTK